MRILSVLLVLTAGAVGSAAADPVLFHPGTGVPNPGQGDSRAMWSEPPDLNGLLASSEQILAFGLETEVANDFIPTEETITHATWWGGYFNNYNTPCQSGISTPGFNLEFFENADCIPGQLIANISITDFTEESIGCQAGVFPLYAYGTDLNFPVVPDGHYWFCAQMKDHAYPPQWGRLDTTQLVECISVGRSAYWSFPDWHTGCDFGGHCFEGSQEFEGDHSEACCFADGHCEFILTGDCEAGGGVAQGQGSVCDPNPCTATPARPASWGAVKALFK